MFVSLLLFFTLPALAQSPLDPTRDATGAPLEGSFHKPLPEKYIWTAPGTPAHPSDRIEHVFPKVTESIEPHFFRAAFDLTTLPRQATLDIAGPRSAEVYLNGHLAEKVDSDVTQPLGMHVFTTSIAPFLHRGHNLIAMKGAWKQAVSIGSIESSNDMFQWNADSGLYDWPRSKRQWRKPPAACFFPRIRRLQFSASPAGVEYEADGKVRFD